LTCQLACRYGVRRTESFTKGYPHRIELAVTLSRFVLTGSSFETQQQLNAKRKEGPLREIRKVGRGRDAAPSVCDDPTSADRGPLRQLFELSVVHACLASFSRLSPTAQTRETGSERHWATAKPAEPPLLGGSDSSCHLVETLREKTSKGHAPLQSVAGPFLGSTDATQATGNSSQERPPFSALNHPGSCQCARPLNLD
jgi:hypothetical protein